jgi:uncharacterized membrane protein
MDDTQTPSGDKHNVTMGIIAYVLFFIPLITGDAKKDPFVKYHVKQGLVLFILAVAINIVGSTMPYFSFWYNIVSLLNLGTLVLFIIGIINVVNGKQEPLPVIGKFADVFKF